MPYPVEPAHIPEVGGSNPLPPTSNYKGLAITPFLFGGLVSKWRHGFLIGICEEVCLMGTDRARKRLLPPPVSHEWQESARYEKYLGF